MKTKAIISAIIVVGVVAIGSIYFMTSKPAHATTTTNTGLTTNNLDSANTNSKNNTTSSNINSNSLATGTNSNSQQSSKTNENNSNNQQNVNTNENNSANQSNTQQNNSTNNQANNNSQTQTKQQPSSTATTAITSTGNFADIINGANYMSGTINGVDVVIPLQGGHVINNLLVLPEYYTSRLNETFTVKIASLGNNNFDMYEYYNGQNTAIYKLKYDVNNGGLPSLGGTFTHTGSNEVTGITFNLVKSDYAGQLQAMPFYHTNIAGSSVLIAPSGQNQFQYSEHYSGDSNAFTLSYDYNITNKNYQLGLKESYNGQTTGEYLLNPINGTNNYSGVFISHPGTSQSKTYNVTLTGSLNP
ncbi:MAG: hypothetical protein ACRCWM_09875 [Sarcina sp.]